MRQATVRSIKILLCLAVSESCFGQGFYSDSFDARSLGMAGAPLAFPTGAASLFVNPASCAFVRGLHGEAGALLNIRQEQFSPSPAPGNSTAAGATDNGVEAYPLGNVIYSPSRYPVGFGVGVNEPFQFHTDWNSQWAGSSIAQQVDGHALYTTLALGYQMSRMLFFGAALHIATGSVDLLQNDSATILTTPTGPVFRGTYGALSQSSGTSAAVGVSAMFVPSPRFSAAIAYVSGTNIPLKGATQIFGTAPASAPQGEFHSQLSLPSLLAVGIAARPSKELTIETGIQIVGWAAMNQLTYNYSDSVGSTVAANFRNSFSLRLGVEYVLMNMLALRAGIRYVSTPVRDSAISPLYPDANAFEFAAGLGLAMSRNIGLDIAYMGSAFASRSATLAGTYGSYDVSQNQFAMTFTLAFEPASNPLRAPLPKR